VTPEEFLADVAVVFTGDATRGAFGSGRLIAPGLVLSAGHVVDYPTRQQPVRTGWKVRVVRERAQNGAWVGSAHEAELIWRGSGGVDLALLRVIGDPVLAPKVMPVFASYGSIGSIDDVDAAGFPQAWFVRTDAVRDYTVRGSLRIATQYGPSAPYAWSVPSADKPDDPNGWKGMSGAAVCKVGPEQELCLFGTVQEVPANFSGGLLEVAQLSAAFADEEFCNSLRVSLGFEPRIVSWIGAIPLDVGAVDRIIPLDFEADAPTQGTLRFSPRNPRVPFLGREAALGALDEFLNAERKHPFAWWLVTGGGGAGKTRLARELCLRIRRRGWRAGFLPSSFVADTSGLDTWIPRTPTLIVADYVMKRIEEIRKLAARLARRDGLPPLRLLLLEREAGKLFENQFLGSDQSDRGMIEQARYQPDALSLSELTEDEVWKLIEACPWRSDGARVPLARNEFFQRLDRLDRRRRPLVAMILADALATSAADAGLGGLETVLQDLLQRDRDHLWPKELGVANTAIGKAEADVAIAFATMVDGLGPSELETITVARGTPINPVILPACGVAIGKPLESDPLLGRLEPDLIGEFFALETLRGDPNNPFAQPPHSWMPKAAWRARGRGMFDFVARAKQTFPKHVAIPQVDITVEGVTESWLLAAFPFFSRANDLTTGFKELQKWVLPHAQSDPGAALAFADLSTSATSFEGGIVDAPVLIALIETLRELLKAHPNEPVLGEQVAKALVNTGARLGALGRNEEAIAGYDEVVGRFGVGSELPLCVAVAMALFNKGVRLGTIGRSEEAIAAFDDVVERFGTASELPLREQVANAMFNKGFMLGTIGRSEEAIAAFDDVVERFGATTDLPLREPIARALFNKGVRLGALGRGEEAILVYSEVVERFGAASELPLAEQVAYAMVNRGITLGALGRSEEAIAAFDDVVERLALASELPLREQVGKAMLTKGIMLAALGHSEEEIAIYDDVVERFGAANELPLREQAVNAMLSKSIVLDALGRSEEVIAVYSDVVERFGAASELPLRELVAIAMLRKGIRLGALGRGEEAIAVYGDVVGRFGAANELPLREQVANAMLSKGRRLGALGRCEEAIAIYGDVVERFGAASELSLREPVANAIFNKGVRLGELGRGEEEIAIYGDVVERFGTASELSLRELVARGLVNKAVRLRALGRSEEAIAVYGDVVDRFGAASELSLREPVAIALVSKGGILAALGRSEEEIAIYGDLVERFGAASELPLRELVCGALINKGATLGARGRSEEAIAVFDDVVERFGAARELALREQVINAMFNKAVALFRLGRSEGAIAVHHDVVERFGAASGRSFLELLMAYPSLQKP
jgi:tetratricopeptide (TPR) repeat protein